jgi:HKD family nuclease
MSVAYRVVGQPGDEMLSAISTLAAAVPFTRVRVAVAYASEAGVRLLAAALRRHSAWEPARKRFIVSIDGGITDPEALDRLAQLATAQLRVPGAREVLAEPDLQRPAIFHPKAYAFDGGTARPPFALLIGSANLSATGLLRNTELGIACTLLSSRAGARAREATDVVSRFDRWWRSQWRQAVPLSRELLATYRRRRAQLHRTALPWLAAEHALAAEHPLLRSVEAGPTLRGRPKLHARAQVHARPTLR